MSIVVVGHKFNSRGSCGTAVHDCWSAIRFAVRENQAMVLLSAVLLAGMILGSNYARGAGMDTLERLDFLFAGNFKARLVQPYINIFTASFASSFLFVFTCFLFGLSMWGACFIPFVLAFRGFGLGLTSGYLYALYSWKGILYNLAVILPGAFICCLAITAASWEGIRFSRFMASQNSGSAYKPNIRSYVLRFGVILFFACVAALVDLLLSVLFGGMFSF